MSLFKKILLSLLIVLVVIQFIKPARNVSGQVLPTDITKIYNVPVSVQHVLKTACYDCHSNNTNYPWYVNIQPISWLLAHHIKDGKAELNFSGFGSYSERKQRSKLNDLAGTVHDNEMPLSSYTLMHKSARLSNNEKALIMDWATKTKDSLTSKIK